MNTTGPDTKAKILIVDDQPANLLAFDAVLRGLGQTIVTARSGEEALERVLESDFAVILLDVQMSGLDGFETAKLIRSHERSRHTPVIFITAYDDNTVSAEAAYALGAVDFLVKPVSPVILSAKVSGLIELFQKTEQIKDQAEKLQRLQLRKFQERLGVKNARLLESEARKSAILETALDSIITMDDQGQILEFNPSAERMFGYSRSEVLGRDLCGLIIPPSFRDAHRQGMAHYLATGQGPILNRRVELPALRADGSELIVELAVTPVSLAGRAVFTAYLRDISHRIVRDRRRAARLAITQILAEARPLNDTTLEFLREVCENLGWDVGALWEADRTAGVLRCVQFWHRPLLTVTDFEKMSREITFPPGRGLPGRVWASKQPFWIADVVHDINFPRAATAAREGLHGAFAFPIVVDQSFIGVVEFFSNQIREPDADLLEMFTTLGSQIGHFYERHRTEEALRESEQRFARFMQHLPGLAWIKDLQGRYIYANDAALKAFRTSPEALFGKTDEESFPPETAESFREHDQRALSSEAGIQVVETLQHEDGVLHHSVVSKFAIPDSDGRPVMVGGMAIDFTDRLRAEEALRESEARFRLLADSAPVLIFVNGLEGCEFVNRGYLDFLGRSMEEVQGMNWAEYLHPDDAPDYVEFYTRAFEAKEPFERQVRLRRVDGVFRWMKAVGIPRLSPEGTFLGYVGCCVDVTDLRLAEEALREEGAQKDEFLAMLAHELRNPLAPIQNAVQIMDLTELDASGAKWCRDLIARQVQHLSRLVDDLLDVSRLTRGKIRLQIQPLELSVVIARAVEASRPLIDARKHNLDVVMPRDPLMVQGDLTRLSQVVLNLLNNSAKYTPEGGQISLVIGREGDEAVIRVRDNGIGMPEELIPRIFELFSQAERSLDRSEGGLGIGLTLVRRLVGLHGGSVHAASEGAGRGSELTVRLPLLLDASRSIPAKRQERQSVPGGKRILVVDDNRDAADSLAMLLELNGNNVFKAYSGTEALNAAEKHCPDVIFLDIGMPGMNGFEVATKLRSAPALRNALLVALTGYGSQDDRRRSEEAGFNAHIVKPVEAEALGDLLTALFEKAP